MRQPILIERDAQVATITLNNPDKLNAMDLSMWQGLTEAIRGLSADDTLRCVVLRGAGDKAFAAGADIAEFDTMRANAAQAQRYGEITNATMRAIAECRHPTVAAIGGVCVGGGDVWAKTGPAASRALKARITNKRLIIIGTLVGNDSSATGVRSKRALRLCATPCIG